MQIIKFRCSNLNPWSQVYKFKHRCMQTSSTNICSRMGGSQKLHQFQRGTVIGCNKSSHEISSLRNIPQSTVSGILTKWKRLGTTARQPRSGRPHKMTERGQWMLRCMVRIGRQLSAVNRYRLPNFIWPYKISSRTMRRELHGMGFHGQAATSKSIAGRTCSLPLMSNTCSSTRATVSSKNWLGSEEVFFFFFVSKQTMGALIVWKCLIFLHKQYKCKVSNSSMQY